MERYLFLTLLLLVLAAPAIAKPHSTVPVPCSDLWSAVEDTLGNAGNYTILASDDSGMTASFTVVEALRMRVNSVALNPEDTGCKLQVKTVSGDSANEDEAPFRKRVEHFLERLKAAKPSAPAKTAGNI